MGSKRAKSSASASRSFNFSLDSLAEVLARLPAKTLLKFRCVCKEWRSLIESPNFASLHASLFKNNRRKECLLLIEGVRRDKCLFLIKRFHWYEGRCFLHDSDTFRKTCELTLPKDLDDGKSAAVGYANGLVLYMTFGLSFVIWNPSIRKSIEISGPFPGLPLGSLSLVGFLYVANDYKVVVIPSVYGKLPHSWYYSKKPSALTVSIGIYSLSTGSWRTFNDDRQRATRRTPECITVLNGVIHWLGCHYTWSTSHIVAFDMQNEIFKYFRLPDLEDTTVRSQRVLAVLGESLAFLEMKSGCSFIWVMDQYGVDNSWVKRFTIDLAYDRFFLLKRSGKLLVTMANKELQEYDVESQEIKDIANIYEDFIVSIDTFVESLTLLTA